MDLSFLILSLFRIVLIKLLFLLLDEPLGR